ncbi:hypothetical protein WH47_01979, partial [Habropoda laboriosa]
FCGKKTVDIATFTAASIFDGGKDKYLRVMQVMHLILGINSHNFCKIMDERRIRNSEEKLLRKAKKETADSFSDAEVLLYGLGIAH